MTLEELETFVCIATAGGVTQASRRLHRSQPAISRRIRQLEQSLGTPLFERDGRTVRVSEPARAFLPYAEAVLAAVRDAERAARGLGESPGASLCLNVAIVGTLADTHIVETLSRFRGRFGPKSLALRTATSREVSALVRRGEADLGVRYFSDPDPRLESIQLGLERLFVVLPAAHPLRATRLRDLRALAAETWLTFPPDPQQPESSGQLHGRLLAAGLTQPELTYVDSLTAQKRLVEAGFGIALLPRSSFREELARGSVRVVAVDQLRVEQPVVAVRRKHSLHPLLPRFLAQLERGIKRSFAGRAQR